MFEDILGWKTIFLFAAGTICGALFILLFIPQEPSRPTLPDELLLQAQAMRLQEAANPDENWRTRIAKAGSEPDPDGALAALGRAALNDGAFNPAFIATGLVHNHALRDVMLREIVAKAFENCPTLPWAAIALRDMGDREKSPQLAKELDERRRQCGQP